MTRREEQIREREINNEDDIYQLAQLLNEDVRRDYSGRGMFGKTCLALTIDPRNYEYGEVEALKELGVVDSMGRGFVVYWPGIKGDQ